MTLPGRDARHSFLCPIEEIIDEARNGRMFILVDDEDRENEGDLIIPAQMATPSAINFMATYGRGLICLALAEKRVGELALDLMSGDNRSRHETAFTVSIEARDGVTTGISAGDRARTVAVAIDASNGPEAIVSPGHVFPLVARPGGVLVRAGHTEAAVDVARLAGLNSSGVICEIMNADGTMSRLDDLVEFAATHSLKIGTIRDLIAYRREHDHNLERVAQSRFTSCWGGEWNAITFRNKAVDTETMAIVKGEIDPSRPALVRMHTVGIFNDVLGMDGERSGILGRSMKSIAEEGAGIVVLLNPRAKLSDLTRYIGGASAPELSELRDYGVGAQVLAELGVRDMVLLTNTRHTLVALAGYGLNVLEERPV